MPLMTPEQIRQAVDEVTKELGRQGKVIEGGWRALILMCRLHDASPVQLSEMRRAYYAGAQHLFASLLTIVEEGAEATELDLTRLKQIHDELDAYVQEMKAQPRN